MRSQGSGVQSNLRRRNEPLLIEQAGNLAQQPFGGVLLTVLLGDSASVAPVDRVPSSLRVGILRIAQPKGNAQLAIAGGDKPSLVQPHLRPLLRCWAAGLNDISRIS